jgi:hypothetical protein
MTVGAAAMLVIEVLPAPQAGLQSANSQSAFFPSTTCQHALAIVGAFGMRWQVEVAGTLWEHQVPTWLPFPVLSMGHSMGLKVVVLLLVLSWYGTACAGPFASNLCRV